MKKEDIFLTDWKRILIGESPATFLVEVLFRTSLIFIVFLLVMKLFGKRMSGQMTIIEMSIIITLGAVIAPAMQLPEKGLLQATLILFVILSLQKILNKASLKSVRFEKLIHGDSSLLLKDGVILEDEMKKCRITHQQLDEKLRQKNIHDHKTVKRIYLEACGAFSIYR